MHTLAQNIINIYGDQGKAWLDNLPERVAELQTAYGLSELKPVQNLTYNYVLSGFQGKQPIILKLGLDGRGLQRESNALKSFEGYGAVKLIDSIENTLLLERAIPGTSLKSYLPAKKDEALHIACNVMKQLQKVPKPTYQFPYIREWLSTIDKDWGLPFLYLQKARQLRDHLLSMLTQDILLHGDLHHDNILLNGNNWVAIDPKGVVGFPINECWSFISDIKQDSQFITEFFNMDLQAIRDWYFVHLILAVCWNLEDNTEPTRFLELAAAAYPLV